MKILKNKSGVIKFLVAISFLIIFLFSTTYCSKKDGIDNNTLDSNETSNINNQKLAKDCLYDFLLNRYNWLNKTYLNEVDLITYTANKYKVYLEKNGKR